MKDIDKKFYKFFKKMVRYQWKSLGSKVNLSPSPCYRRVKNLKDAGFIDRNVAVLNKQKLNLNALILFILKPQVTIKNGQINLEKL